MYIYIICQPLSRFGIFTFVALYKMPFIVFHCVT